jgi:hypothetical protein
MLNVSFFQLEGDHAESLDEFGMADAASKAQDSASESVDAGEEDASDYNGHSSDDCRFDTTFDFRPSAPGAIPSANAKEGRPPAKRYFLPKMDSLATQLFGNALPKQIGDSGDRSASSGHDPSPATFTLSSQKAMSFTPSNPLAANISRNDEAKVNQPKERHAHKLTYDIGVSTVRFLSEVTVDGVVYRRGDGVFLEKANGATSAQGVSDVNWLPHQGGKEVWFAQIEHIYQRFSLHFDVESEKSRETLVSGDHSAPIEKSRTRMRERDKTESPTLPCPLSQSFYL